MNELLEGLNQIAQLALALAGIVTTVVAALAGTRYRESKAVETAARTTEIIQQVATIAVKATEQAMPAGSTSAGKLADALRRANAALLASGIVPAAGQVETAIEAAVHAIQPAKPAPKKGAP